MKDELHTGIEQQRVSVYHRVAVTKTPKEMVHSPPQTLQSLSKSQPTVRRCR